jgi:membrane-bound serine protease (ClpP class)
MLFDRNEPAFRLSLAYIIPATIITALFFVFVVGKGLTAQRLPVKAGRETMIGQKVEALTAIDQGQGRVFIEGENWNAVSDTPVKKGQLVEVLRVQGLTLHVTPAIST